MARTINTSSESTSASSTGCEYKYSPINTTGLPRPHFLLPEDCTNLSQTAKYQIKAIQNQLEESLRLHSSTVTATPSDIDIDIHTSITEMQDAIDDGFLLCDLKTIQRKLKAWKIMFPRIKPFFAIKCNPDCMVSHVLGQTVHIHEEYEYGLINDNSGDEKLCMGANENMCTCTCCCGFDCASLAEIQLALQSSYCNNNNNNNNGNNNDNASTNTSTNKSSSGSNKSNKKCIVYANPQRSIHDLDKALELGVHALTFDSVEELYKVKDAYERLLVKRQKQQQTQQNENENEHGQLQLQVLEPPEMIVRIVVPDTHSSVPLGEKFGVEPRLVKQLTQKALELNLNVIGVSFHCGSGNHDPTSYRDAIVIAKSCIDEINDILRQFDKSDCCVLDIGGGYPGYDGVGGDFGRFGSSTSNNLNSANSNLSLEMNEKYDRGNDTAYNIAEVVSPLIDELFPLQEGGIDIISEPGRYFVEAAFAYCARIYSVKKTGRQCNDGSDSSNTLCNHYYIAQGVQGLFKDVILCDEIFTPIPLRVDEDSTNEQNDDINSIEKKDSEQVIPSIVYGPSGESFDIVCKDCMLPQLKEGDWLLFDRMGAYTLSIAARNSSLPIRYVI